MENSQISVQPLDVQQTCQAIVTGWGGNTLPCIKFNGVMDIVGRPSKATYVVTTPNRVFIDGFALNDHGTQPTAVCTVHARKTAEAVMCRKVLANELKS